MSSIETCIDDQIKRLDHEPLTEKDNEKKDKYSNTIA